MGVPTKKEATRTRKIGRRHGLPVVQEVAANLKTGTKVGRIETPWAYAPTGSPNADTAPRKPCGKQR